MKMAYSIAEVSELVGVGRTTLYHAVKMGELQVCKIGRRTIIRAECLRAFIDSRPTADQAQPSNK